MQNDPKTQQEIDEMKLIMDIMVQQAILRGQMEALAAVMEILEPSLGIMPNSSGLAATVSIAGSEWARPLLADMHMVIGGLDKDIKVVKVQELGTAISVKGLELAQAHGMVSAVLQEKVSEIAVAAGIELS